MTQLYVLFWRDSCQTPEGTAILSNLVPTRY
jgi:hypothetical protein